MPRPSSTHLVTARRMAEATHDCQRCHQYRSIAKRDIPLGDAKEIVFNNVSAVILNRPGKGLIAVSRVCTHLGCLVQYDKENKRLLCPCHAGVYDLEGNIVSAPPPKPLPKLPLRIEGETIVKG